MKKRIGRGHTRCTTKGVKGTATIERIGSQIVPQANGCWLWRGRTDIYGKANEHGSQLTVHRYVYEILVGPIPDGCHLHHECETPSCCNPAHLVPLTPKEHKAAHRELSRRP